MTVRKKTKTIKIPAIPEAKKRVTVYVTTDGIEHDNEYTANLHQYKLDYEEIEFVDEDISKWRYGEFTVGELRSMFANYKDEDSIIFDIIERYGDCFPSIKIRRKKQ